jgi:hypothetical protein
MQLPLGDGVGVATLGPQLKLKKNSFQGVVVQVRDVASVSLVLERVRALPRLRRYQHMPHATRVRTESTLHPAVLQQTSQPEPEDDYVKKLKKMYRPPEDPTVVEDWEDDGEPGIGDRLLHVLQRWQVENVLLVVARQDDSLSGRLIGHEIFKLMAETAKLALEQYYLSNIKPSDAAKIEIFEAERGNAQYMISPRDPPDDQQQQGKVPPKQRASVCLMTSDTVASWPQHHQATSDGGGRKAAKKGRVNHFLHGRKPSTTAPQDSSAEAASPEKQASENNTPDETDALLACEGIDWLGITRDEWLKLRTIRVPVKELHYLFMCLVVLVDKPFEKQTKAAPTSRQNEQFTSPSYSWSRCRDVLQHTAQWSERLRHFHGSSLCKSQATALRSVLQEPSVHETAFVRICSASVKLFTWVQRLLDEHDEHELGIANGLAPGMEAATPREPQVMPQPPASKAKPSQPRKPTSHSLSFSPSSAEETALVRELNALANAKKNKIVDRGRLMSYKHLN